MKRAVYEYKCSKDKSIQYIGFTLKSFRSTEKIVKKHTKLLTSLKTDKVIKI